MAASLAKSEGRKTRSCAQDQAMMVQQLPGNEASRLASSCSAKCSAVSRRLLKTPGLEARSQTFFPSSRDAVE